MEWIEIEAIEDEHFYSMALSVMKMHDGDVALKASDEKGHTTVLLSPTGARDLIKVLGGRPA